MWFDNMPIIALAPMADLTDSPFCRICREVAGTDFVIFREMVSTEAIVRGNAKTLKMCEFEKIERPIVLQLFGSDADVVRKAARIVVDKFKPDGIDINMGCPVPKIVGKSDSGAALMKDHDRAVRIVGALKSENLGVPISVKTRLGWSKDDEILEFAPRLAAAGADLISIHGRTKAQGYSGFANWSMIGQVKKLISIPVIANGDITCWEDIDKCLKITGADGVMIGRAAIGNPWIFKNLKPTSEELVATVLRHARLHIERYGAKSMVTFRKHLAWYFKGTRGTKDLRSRLVLIKSISELEEILNLNFPRK
ncbi:MAG: tRNA-dihydrouridine synthase [Patescibacteria group bacterium]